MPGSPASCPLKLSALAMSSSPAVPGEFTTMSGRRLKEMIADELTAADITDHHVVLSGLSNAYSSYVATFEEYQIQRYEGASTIFGPYTLDAYLQQYQSLIQNLTQGQQVPSGPDPPNLISKQISMRPGVVFDSSPRGKPFGTVLTEPDDFYAIGSTVSVTFVAGHPRNNLQLESSFLTVERLDDKTGQWKVIATDGNLNTKFIWKRTNAVLGQSTAKVLWETETGTVSGLYRIGHTGSYRTLFQQVKSYTGTSKSFKVGPSF
ncbi:Neutral ceramidase [Halotydeus destructor]|nr:Neutral ceramidase [Halotydeus destructor]